MPAPTTTTIEAGSNTFTTPQGCDYIIVEILGGGGAGAFSRDGDDMFGAGGGAGGYRKSVLPPGSYSYTVGTKGLASSSDSQKGGDGSSTTFHDFTVGGGLGGAATTNNGGIGGLGGSGSNLGTGLLFTVDGMRGGGSTDKTPGIGGWTMYGYPPLFKSQSSYHGVGYGFGGSSGATDNVPGKNGGDGVIIITVYYLNPQLNVSSLTSSTITTDTISATSLSLPVTNFVTSLQALTNSFTFVLYSKQEIIYTVINNICFVSINIVCTTNVNRFGVNPRASYGITLPLPAASTTIIRFSKSFFGVTTPGSSTLEILDFNQNFVELLSGDYTFKATGFYFV